MSGKIYLISLGCSKNQVDAEVMLAKLSDAGFEIVDNGYEADLIIVNTCGFIESAKRESIAGILDAVSYKEDDENKKVLVTGCLAQRYQDDLLTEIPEANGIIGIGANADIVDICERVLQGEEISEFPPKEDLTICGKRILTTPSYWAYLKIAEGCSNCCTYCAIPQIRGKYRSRPMEEIIDEAKELVENGVKELVLIAQDTTRYGEDLYGELKLPELLRKLCEINDLKWIRLLYCYPDKITDELLDVIAEERKICKYIDLPLQHADEKILKAMNRTGSYDSLKKLIEKIRYKVPRVIIRTTLIVGFPGEGSDEFETLCDFVKEMRFDLLGCFTYSAEEGTIASTLPDQVDEDVKNHRSEIITELQNEIFEEKLKEKLEGSWGEVVKSLEVVVDGYDDYVDCYYGRSYMDAPETDNVIYFTCGFPLEEGDFVEIEVFDVGEDGYLIGEVI